MLAAHRPARLRSRATEHMNVYSGAIIGCFIGFVFGVGCALAVMYSIYSGGYRKAVEESLMADTPERYARALAKASKLQS